jgi:hypothetical protein
MTGETRKDRLAGGLIHSIWSCGIIGHAITRNLIGKLKGLAP